MKRALSLMGGLLLAVPVFAQTAPLPEPSTDLMLLAAGATGAVIMALRLRKK
jgi:hypothetical protein